MNCSTTAQAQSKTAATYKYSLFPEQVQLLVIAVLFKISLANGVYTAIVILHRLIEFKSRPTSKYYEHRQIQIMDLLKKISFPSVKCWYAVSWRFKPPLYHFVESMCALNCHWYILETSQTFYISFSLNSGKN